MPHADSAPFGTGCVDAHSLLGCRGEQGETVSGDLDRLRGVARHVCGRARSLPAGCSTWTPCVSPLPASMWPTLWTAEPRKVDRARQHLERVPTQAVDRLPSSDPQPAQPQVATSAIAPAPVDATPVDTVTTASVQDTGGRARARIGCPWRRARARCSPRRRISSPSRIWNGAPSATAPIVRRTTATHPTMAGSSACVSPYSGGPAQEEVASTLGAAPVVRALSGSRRL